MRRSTSGNSGEAARRMFQEGGSSRSASRMMFRLELRPSNGAPSQTALVTREATVKQTGAATRR